VLAVVETRISVRLRRFDASASLSCLLTPKLCTVGNLVESDSGDADHSSGRQDILLHKVLKSLLDLTTAILTTVTYDNSRSDVKSISHRWRYQQTRPIICRDAKLDRALLPHVLFEGLPSVVGTIAGAGHPCGQRQADKDATLVVNREAVAIERGRKAAASIKRGLLKPGECDEVDNAA
jgi:hypothetical protein